jgi:putative PIN family toxin of toxin-antitoxin system
VRVVLDTNILISAFVFPGGAPEDVFRSVLEGRIELVTSPPLLAEFGRVLSSKFGWEPSMAEQAVALVANVGSVVRPKVKVEDVAEDPDDDRVLEAALEGQAEVIVSGDRHLLRLRIWRGVKIVKAASFLRSLHGV